METFMLLLAVAFGLFIGFGVGVFFTKRRFADQDLEQQNRKLSDQMAQLKQEFSDYLARNQVLSNQIKNHYEQFNQQIDDAYHVLKLSEQERVPFFSAQTTAELKQAGSDRRRKTSQSDHQPLDYAGPSGLFSNDAIIVEKVAPTVPADFADGRSGLFSNKN